MNEENSRLMTMREIGKLYNVSSHVVGRWLTRLQLREDGQPTDKAKAGGYCTFTCSQDRGICFYVWNAEKTLAALESFIEECMEKKGAANEK